TQGLVDLISMAHRRAADGAGLLDTLPVAGEPGTLRPTLRRSGKRVRAETGTLDGVSGLTGVLTRESGEPQLAVSVVTTVADSGRLYGQARRRVEDQIVMGLLAALARYEARPEPTWRVLLSLLRTFRDVRDVQSFDALS